MRIDLLKSNPDRAGRYYIQFDDGSSMRLYRQTIQDFTLYPGLELSDETYKKLVAAANEMSAKMRAVRIVSASNISKKELEKRLVQKGERASAAANAVSWLEELNLLDDRKTAEQVVHSCISKGYGRSRAKQVLFEKKIPKELWDSVLEDYPDQADRILDFLRTRLGEDSDERDVKRAVDALLRKGHSYKMIRNALDMLAFDSDYIQEDI